MDTIEYVLDLEDLIGIVCRFSPEHIVEHVIYDFSEHKYLSDAALNDSFGYFLVKEAEETLAPNEPPISKLISLAGYYSRAAQDLNRIVDRLAEYTRFWALRQFLEWFSRQKRATFNWELFHAWVTVHETPEIRAAADALRQQLESLLPELGSFQGNSFPVDAAWLAFAMDKVCSELRKCKPTETSTSIPKQPPKEPENPTPSSNVSNPADPQVSAI
jgi:hypothetical protein